jgi:hypothetical protein
LKFKLKITGIRTAIHKETKPESSDSTGAYDVSCCPIF